MMSWPKTLETSNNLLISFMLLNWLMR